MMKTISWMRTSLLAGAALGAVLLGSGCGGVSTSNSSASPQGPAAYGLGSPKSGQAGSEVSGLGLPANASSPTAADVGYDTFATAITPLGNTPQPLIATASAALVPPYPYVGEAAPPLGAAVPAGKAGVTFRVEVANGQTSNGGVPTITSVALTSSDPQWTLGTLPLTFQYSNATAAGPFVDAPYTTAPFTLPFTTSGAHAVSVTVTDSAGQSTRTDYVIEVVSPTDIFVTINTVDTGTKDKDGTEVFATLAAGDTATLTSATGTVQTATADAVGTASFFVTPGTYTLTVKTKDAAGKPITYTQTLDLTKTAPGGSFAQAKRRAGMKRS